MKRPSRSVAILGEQNTLPVSRPEIQLQVVFWRLHLSLRLSNNFQVKNRGIGDNRERGVALNFSTQSVTITLAGYDSHLPFVLSNSDRTSEPLRK